MADTNLEDVLEQLQFNYGGVLQKLAELHDEVVDQMEMLRRQERKSAAGIRVMQKTPFLSVLDGTMETSS